MNQHNKNDGFSKEERATFWNSLSATGASMFWEALLHVVLYRCQNASDDAKLKVPAAMNDASVAFVTNTKRAPWTFSWESLTALKVTLVQSC
jgi:hypothetical protein